MSIRLGKINLKIHVLLPVLWLFVWITGAGSELIPSFLALMLHETGHLLAAKHLKMQVENIEITPYGGVIGITDMENAAPLSSFILAAAGPLFSLFGCLLTILIAKWQMVSYAFAQGFARGNLILFILNLFPALPMDGGRMMRSILVHYFPYNRATKLLTGLGVIFGLFLCALSFYFALQGQINLSPAFAGFYLIYAAAIEQKQGTMRYISSLIARRQQLEKNQIIPVETIAAGGNMNIISLLGSLSSGKYHRIIVLSDDGIKPVGMIEEEQICNAALQTPNAELKLLILSKENGQANA